MPRARVSLDPGRVGGMDGGDVFEDDIIHEVWCRGRIAQRANAHGTRFVAGYVLDVDVATVAFDGYAVLFRVDSGSARERADGMNEHRFDKQQDGHTSPHVTTQFLIVMSFEFQVSVPSVLTVDH